MISHAEAQELHEIIGSLLEEELGLVDDSNMIRDLRRARELAAIIVSDTDQ